MNVNEIIANLSLRELGYAPGAYHMVDPIESANVYQSTNDVIPTALTIAAMQLLTALEDKINDTRMQLEHLETTYRNTLRLAYTQMQEAVPSTYGQLFSTYSEALSRDWWRVSKAFERIKVVNLGGGATGTGISLPRFYVMEVVSQLKKDTKLPVTQGENLADATSNTDRFVEVHAIMKAHAVNLEKIVSDLRLLSSGITREKEIIIPQKQVGSSIMPGKVNPVIPEFIISGAHQIYANDQLISSLSAQGCLDLNAYLPSIGHALLQSLKLLIGMNESIRHHLLEGLRVREEVARARVYECPAISTCVSPIVGYNKATELAKYMERHEKDIFEANRDLGILNHRTLEKILKPEYLLQKGFSLKDIRNMNRE
jgi:aspartate ammonia-lyase